MKLILFLFLVYLPLTFSLQAQEKLWLGWSLDGVEYEWRQFESDKGRGHGIDSLLLSYQAQGYLGAFIQNQRVQGDSLWIKFETGKKIEEVILSQGNLPSTMAKELNLGKLSFAQVNSIFDRIVGISENQGYPFASVQMDSLERTENGIKASIIYESGPLIVWDSISLDGTPKTKAKYFQRFSGLIPNDPFSQKELERASRLANRSPYFRLRSQPEVEFRIQKAQPVFSLVERNSNVLDGIIGFLPNQNEPGKVLITGQLDLQLFHLGGKGRDVEVSWQRFNELTQNLNIKAKESFLFNSPLDVGGEFSLLKQDSTFINRNLGLRVGYNASSSLYLTFFTNRKASDLLSTFAFRQVEQLPDVADFRWNEYGLGVDFNLLDDVIAPRKGWKVSGKISAGNKRILQNTGIPEAVYQDLELSNPQYSVSLIWEKHLFLKPSWGMYFGGAGGFVRNETLLVNDLFRLGGLKSIRGFNENFFFASSFAYLNAEQRLFFGENSFLLAFIDLGILENPYFANSFDRPVSFGAGLNFETGSGIFRFIHAIGKSNEQQASFSQSKIHFGYLARF